MCKNVFFSYIYLLVYILYLFAYEQCNKIVDIISKN